MAVKRPRDTNELAKRVVDLAIGEATDREPEPTGPQRRGLARAAKLSPERRCQIAKKAAAARWGQKNT